MKRKLLFCFICLLALQVAKAQRKVEFDGQASAFGSYSPDNQLPLFSGGRYIPELNYGVELDSGKAFEFEASVNIAGSVFFQPFDAASWNGNISPYRLWGRYTGKQFEVRAGLQKIDFGVATLLRPLQWFNQIDPRDPLQLTNGVYGLLGRYYFLNNANIWLWGLYGNEKARGLDASETYAKHPEYGGRFQYPVPRGEIALSYHHRTADSRTLVDAPQFEQVPEDRYGLDGKWDVGIGLWFEVSHIHKRENLGALTNQTLLNVGADYTFGIGSGLNVVAEHLIMGYDSEAVGFDNRSHITAATLAYPLGFFDHISTIFYYNWPTADFTFFFNYEHQFNKLVGYIMPYYSPPVQQGIQENNLVNATSGPGLRLMLVYNH
ncbi:hypothetical protein [Marinoscillum sp.]|uniref:hypothetical protein n=1 Tax=Marinoscillum sp. TaxID=2024838 RepID=UPI003BA9DA07